VTGEQWPKEAGLTEETGVSKCRRARWVSEGRVSWRDWLGYGCT